MSTVPTRPPGSIPEERASTSHQGRRNVIRSKKSVVGLDLGSSVVKAIELTLEGNEPVITGFSRIELPPGGSVDEAVKQVFKEGNFRSKRVVTGVSGQDTVVRYLSMPRMTDAELRQAIQFEADKLVASDEDFIIDCAPLGQVDGDEEDQAAAGEMKVLVAACPQARLEGQASMVTAAGLTPIAIDLDLFAVANAWELCALPGRRRPRRRGRARDGARRCRREHHLDQRDARRGSAASAVRSRSAARA